MDILDLSRISTPLQLPDISVRELSEGLPGPSPLLGSGVPGSPSGPSPVPSLAVMGVVFVMEVVMLGESREQVGRLEEPVVRGESDMELGTGGPGLDNSLTHANLAICIYVTLDDSHS